MPPRETLQPTPELKERFAALTREAQREAPDFKLAIGCEVLTPDDMIRHVQDETAIGIRLLSMFFRDEKKNES